MPVKTDAEGYAINEDGSRKINKKGQQYRPPNPNNLSSRGYAKRLRNMVNALNNMLSKAGERGVTATIAIDPEKPEAPIVLGKMQIVTTEEV